MDVQYPFTMTFTNESNLYTTNTMYSFRTSVNPPMQLPIKGWEVGLSKIIIPHTRHVFLPFSRLRITLTVTPIDEEDGLLEFPPMPTNAIIGSGSFHSMDDLCLHLQQEISRTLPNLYISHPNLFHRGGFYAALPEVTFEVKLLNGRVWLSSVRLVSLSQLYTQQATLKVSEGLELWSILGFRKILLGQEYKLPLLADSYPSFAIESSTLAVSAPNLVVEQLVGDGQRPLLELIPYNMSSSLPYTVFEQRYPLYKTVYGGYINSVHIVLSDIDDKPVYFETGKLQIVLHFRQCQTTNNE